jgi:competence protein ComEA
MAGDNRPAEALLSPLGCFRMQTPPDEKTPSIFWLRPHDQRTIAVLAMAIIIAMALAWLVLGGASGKLVEIDRQPRRAAPFRVDLNTAQWPELAQLPGIGETLARRIVESREMAGPFASPEALLRVSGVGPKKFERIKPFLLPIEPPTRLPATATPQPP